MSNVAPLHRAVLGLGSNTPGRRSINLITALNHLGRRVGKVLDVSSFYETQPYGPSSGTQLYINAVVVVETNLGIEEINMLLKSIEKEAGRDREADKHYIPIDIDLVIWDEEILRPHEIDRDYFARGWNELKRHV